MMAMGAKNFAKRVSSATMILEDSEGRVLIVKANYKTYWAFPGGVIDQNETPKQAAIRETYEEVGIQIPSDDVEFVAVVDRLSDVAQTYQFIFKAPLPTGARESITLQADEIDEYAFITKAQAKTHDRHYGKVVEHWTEGRTGYIEQLFG